MRPRRKESIKVAKNDVMSVRVSKEDKTKYSAEAEQYGMNLSEYILYLLNHKEVNVVEGSSELVQAIYDLNCTLEKYGSSSDVSIDELRNLISGCVDKMNRFYERL